MLKDIPIKKQLMTVILFISGTVLILTCTAFIAYDFYTFKKTTIQQLSTLAEIIASNSTAALAFDSREDADEILSSLKAEKNIGTASLYDKEGHLFSQYPEEATVSEFLAMSSENGFYFKGSNIEGVQTVLQGDRKLGTLHLSYNIRIIQERLRSYILISILVFLISFVLAYQLSRISQKSISSPILNLANIARAISERHDYSVRAPLTGKDEIGLLNNAFNRMLTQIQEQNQSLLDKNNELKKTNEDLDSFVYAASHDLKSPIVNIDGLFNLLAPEIYSKNETTNYLIDRMQHSITRLKRTITDLSTAAKAQKNIFDDIEEVKFEDVFQEVSIDIETLINSSNAEIKTDFCELSTIKYSRTAIKSVMYNLLSNSIKYKSYDRPPVVHIETGKINGKKVLTVKDNGLGIDLNKDKEKLFAIFKRLHSHVEGTGIGLYAVKRIIENNNGSIEVESTINKGTLFKIFFN
ncbi:ATP-binding protein [Reichenbachiella sp. MALMAid0571]|uniref:ATP-binding protein n=1 Tax=Reichenbachiella sp. MALMAid0571 TaxID=3143939 RepID=UPI0032DFB507